MLAWVDSARRVTARHIDPSTYNKDEAIPRINRVRYGAGNAQCRSGFEGDRVWVVMEVGMRGCVGLCRHFEESKINCREGASDISASSFVALARQTFPHGAPFPELDIKEEKLVSVRIRPHLIGSFCMFTPCFPAYESSVSRGLKTFMPTP